MSDKSQDTIDQEMAAYKTLGSLDQRDAVATSELSNVIDALRSDLSTKLDCETGNPIVSGAVKTLSGIQTSGDIEIYGHTIKVLSGNYIQTDDALGYVQNYSARNSFLQAECSQKYYNKYGIACTGSKGYCILSINTSQRYIRLSGDLTDLANFHAISSAEPFSISFDSGAFSRELRILSVVQDNSEWGHVITDIATRIGDKSENICRDKWLSDDNAFYCPKAPHVGNTAIPAFYGSHAEGASTKAIQRCTHAEGRNTLADIRYSHAEGSDTYAAEMYSHAEGNTTKALGRASHSEGNNTTAKGENSHAEGTNTTAFGVESHAEGSSTNALSDASHAEGFATYANKYAHAEGEQTSALGMDSHAEGRLTLASASGAHAEGQSSVASGNYSHAEGNWTQALSEYSHAEGISTVVSGLWSHAEGYQTSAFGNYSHAEGGLTLAGKVKSGSTAATYSTHAEGYQTSAIGIASHASGIKTNVSNDYAFGWNGKSDETYSSHGNGTFNINPANGISGFWIGTKNLGQYISEINSSITSISSNYTLKSEARDMSAYALQQASSYTNTVSSNLSTALTSTINIVSGETLESAYFYARETSANALSDAKTYADGISSELCTTVDTRLSNLSVELSGDYYEKIDALKTDLKNKLTAVYSLSHLTRDSNLEDVGIDAVLSLRNIISSLIEVLA